MKLKKGFRQLVDEAKARITTISLDDGEADALRRHAHTLKGAIGHVSPRGHAISEMLETLGREGRTGDAVASFAALTAELAALDPALRRFIRTETGESSP